MKLLIFLLFLIPAISISQPTTQNTSETATKNAAVQSDSHEQKSERAKITRKKSYNLTGVDALNDTADYLAKESKDEIESLTKREDLTFSSIKPEVIIDLNMRGGAPTFVIMGRATASNAKSSNWVIFWIIEDDDDDEFLNFTAIYAAVGSSTYTDSDKYHKIVNRYKSMYSEFLAKR